MVIVEISPERTLLGRDTTDRLAGQLEIRPHTCFPIFDPEHEIDRFPLLPKDEVEEAFKEGVSLSGGVTSDCVSHNGLIYKRFRPHHSTKYDHPLPIERGSTEWRVISQLQKKGISDIPKILGVYATSDIFVSKMDRLPGVLACDVMMNGTFDGEQAGAQVGAFLRNFHSVNFGIATVRSSWLYPMLLSKKMDCDEFEVIAHRRHAEAFNAAHTESVLCWGDAGLKNIMLDGPHTRFFDFDQVVWASPEFDLGYLLGHVDLYRVCGYCSEQTVDIFKTNLLKAYGAQLNESLINFIWGSTMYYRRDGYAITGIKERGKKDEIIARAIEVANKE
jgi:aminoglycoside phosphotransferase